MDFRTLASSDCVDKIKCTSCKNYLSYFPITISQDHILCGRCPSTDGHFSIRYDSFEALAQFIRFPCRYESEGCCEELLPKEIPSHEENCEYRVIPCTLTESMACVWQGPRNDLLDHCLESHSDLVLKNKEFYLDLTKSENVRNVLEQEGLPIFLERKFDAEKKKLEFALYTSVYEPKMKNVPCHLEIACGENSLRIKFYSSNEAEYDLKELNLVSIIDAFGDEELKGARGRLIIKDPTVDLLSPLKCTKCFEYAVPPIFYSKEISLSCLNCEQEYLSTGKLVKSMLNYPCKYTMNGCTYVAKPEGPEKIIKHQAVCEFRNFACPCADHVQNGCTWNGTLIDVTDHFQSSHSDIKIHKNGTIISTVLNRGIILHRILKFANRLFRLSYYTTKNQDETYYFEVQVIGPCSDYFEYEIEILSKSTKKTRLLARKTCNHMTAFDRLYKNSKSYCFFQKGQMTGCVVYESNNNISFDFRVNIFK